MAKLISLRARCALLLSAIILIATVLKAQVSTNGLVAFYAFNANALDASGNGHHGTVSGATLTLDRFGSSNGAYYFDGSASIDVGNLGSISDYTVALWFKKAQATGFPASGEADLFGTQNPAAGNLMFKFGFHQDAKDYPMIQVNTGGQNYSTLRSSSSIQDNLWHLIAVTRTGATIRMFIDGAEKSLVTMASPTGSPVGTIATGITTAIGTVSGSTDTKFNGSIDDIRIYSRVMSAIEISATYTEGGWPSGSLANTKFVFSSNAFDGANRYQIYKSNSDGSNWIRLTNNSATESDPHWSPDGAKIVFYSNRDGNNEIYIMNADGTNQTRITNNPAGDSSPAWSPDGSKIAFTSDRDGNNEIYVMNIDGTGQTRLTSNSASDGAASWSPDGSKIAFWTDRDGNGEIYLMNADGTGQTRLTNNYGGVIKVVYHQPFFELLDIRPVGKDCSLSDGISF